MSSSPEDRTDPSRTLWTARGRHLGYAAAGVVRARLQTLKDTGTLQDFLELPEDECPPGRRGFEARWQVEGTVTVRAGLTVAEGADHGQEWTLIAQADQPWDLHWPAPSEMFWPHEPDGTWAHESPTGLGHLRPNALPEDDKAMRRVLRDAVRDSWNVHVVVHEAMTPDERGRAPLTPYLPPGLHHRVVEHRAAPHQLRAVNWALREFGVEVPRGGALVLPGIPAPSGSDTGALTVRTVFLDGSEPVELIDAVTRFAALSRPLPEGAGEALATLQEHWHLFTVEEELERQRRLVTMYAEALEAMTHSRDLYREAAERAHEALAALREAAGSSPAPPLPAARAGSPSFPQLTRTLERLKGTAKSLRPPAGPRRADGGEVDASEGHAAP
ncbi:MULTISPECIES: hypothetical protein [unclassified Streptomyces]|uniref:hypothetical protein n=1 Tax=unclassified Streptomyces TaxID=2593676 RepID=UPI001F04E686|nr:MULTISPECIES: hypothetical protein [unclassified Streptomyces]MCH0566550.1 hypothetical protein [Streptomyces sp. MUM 2J]MCH0571830.1 hypothetical protein [Streptomyces sp. MUM 136J]